MSGAFTYPGVYIQELPSPVHTIVGVPTAITAIIGVAPRGPVDDPTPVSSPAEYRRTFGGDGTSPLDIAVGLFFQNGGGEAIIIRASAGAGAVARASGTLPDGKQLLASSAGAWGDDLSVQVDKTNIPAADQATKYNLTISYAPKDPVSKAIDQSSAITERYVGISTDANSPRALSRVISGSRLVVVETAAQAAAAAAAAVAGGAAAPAGGAAASAGGAAAPAGGAAAPAGGAAAPPPPPPPIGFGGGGDGVPTDKDIIGSPDKPSGAFAVIKHNTFFNLMVLTPASNTPAGDTTQAFDPVALGTVAKFCLDHRAMLIVDPPPDWTDVASATKGRDEFFTHFTNAPANAAVYFPRITVPDPRGGTIENIGPSPAIAGLYAATDAIRGVWKAPAGFTVGVGGISNLAFRMSDFENGLLNPLGVNCLRVLPIAGNVVWGARTMDGADVTASQWKYVPIRRLALFIEESLFRGTQWVVFEPNDEPLWAQVRLNVGAFMHTLFRQGAFQGTTAKDAYFVKCDKDTNPQADIDRGILNVIVGFAPLKPAEFVVIKIQQITGQIEV